MVIPDRRPLVRYSNLYPKGWTNAVVSATDAYAVRIAQTQLLKQAHDGVMGWGSTVSAAGVRTATVLAFLWEDAPNEEDSYATGTAFWGHYGLSLQNDLFLGPIFADYVGIHAAAGIRFMASLRDSDITTGAQVAVPAAQRLAQLCEQVYYLKCRLGSVLYGAYIDSMTNDPDALAALNQRYPDLIFVPECGASPNRALFNVPNMYNLWMPNGAQYADPTTPYTTPANIVSDCRAAGYKFCRGTMGGFSIDTTTQASHKRMIQGLLNQDMLWILQPGQVPDFGKQLAALGSTLSVPSINAPTPVS